jgi:hypothetical protein
MINWSQRYANENEEEEEISPWHPFETEEEYKEFQRKGEDEYYAELDRQETHAKNHKFYVDNFARRGLKDTNEAKEYYRTNVVPYKP